MGRRDKGKRYSTKSNVLRLSSSKRSKKSYNLQSAWAARSARNEAARIQRQIQKAEEEKAQAEREQQSSAERSRKFREKLKNNPDLLEQYRRKHKERNGKRLKVADMGRVQLKTQRAQWRKRDKIRREKEEAEKRFQLEAERLAKLEAVRKRRKELYAAKKRAQAQNKQQSILKDQGLLEKSGDSTRQTMHPAEVDALFKLTTMSRTKFIRQTEASPAAIHDQCEQDPLAGPIVNVPIESVPSGFEGTTCIVIKQETCDGETPEQWATIRLEEVPIEDSDTTPIEIPLKSETILIPGGAIPVDLEEDDLHYFKSLAPDLFKLSPELKDVFRTKVKNILKELTIES